MGIVEIIAIVISVLLVWAIGNYGKDTSLGILGSIMLALFTTPVIAFLIIQIFFKQPRRRLTKIYQSPYKSV